MAEMQSETLRERMEREHPEVMEKARQDARRERYAAAMYAADRRNGPPWDALFENDRSVYRAVADAAIAVADTEQLETEPRPAKATRSGVSDMYAERRVAEFDRLRDRMAEAIHEDARRPQSERVGIINAILNLREIRRPFEERDNLREGARYWIDYAGAYAEGKDRAEAHLRRVREVADILGLGPSDPIRVALDGEA